MQEHIERVQLAEQLGFKAVWLRDVLFNVPSFGDAGQVYLTPLFISVRCPLPVKTLRWGLPH